MGALRPVPRWSSSSTRWEDSAALIHAEGSLGRGPSKPGPPGGWAWVVMTYVGMLELQQCFVDGPRALKAGAAWRVGGGVGRGDALVSCDTTRTM